jgi:hypothetical protein
MRNGMGLSSITEKEDLAVKKILEENFCNRNAINSSSSRMIEADGPSQPSPPYTPNPQRSSYPGILVSNSSARQGVKRLTR